MSEFNISIPGGESKRLKTGGKYCPADIVVTAEGGTSVEDAVLDGSFTGEYVNDRITKMRPYAFSYFTATTIRLPSLLTPNYSCFSYAKAERIEMPAVTGAGTTHMCTDCTNLTVIDCGRMTSMGTVSFVRCSNLETVILRRTSITGLPNVNVFDGSRFASGGAGGKIYVPSALIEIYKTATNWSVLYGRGTCEFVAIEGSEYE